MSLSRFSITVIAAGAVGMLTAWTSACTAPTVSGAPSPDNTPNDTDRSTSADDGGLSESQTDSGAGRSAAAERVITAQCDWDFRCDTYNARMEAATSAACAAQRVGSFKEVLAADGVTVTEAQLLACAAKLATASCDPDRRAIAECNFLGTRPTDSPCWAGEQCRTGYCAYANTGSCPVCTEVPSSRPWVGENESCADFPFCKPSLVCRTSTKTCVPAAKVGEDCSDVRCDEKLGQWCLLVDGSNTETKCGPAPFAQLGGACGFITAVRAFVTCEASTCNATNGGVGTCVPYLKEGSPCAEVGPSCDGGLWCVDGTCQKAVPDTCK